MTQNTIHTMRQLMFAAALLLGLSLSMVSCDSKQQPVSENPKADIVEEDVPQIEEEAVDTISWTYDHAEDTVMIGTYVFASQPVPEEVETRMRGRSFPDRFALHLQDFVFTGLSHLQHAPSG